MVPMGATQKSARVGCQKLPAQGPNARPWAGMHTALTVLINEVSKNAKLPKLIPASVKLDKPPWFVYFHYNWSSFSIDPSI